jgi:hypothetical protein
VSVPSSECAPPGTKGGTHSPAGEGVGEVPIRTTGEKAWHPVFSVHIEKKVGMGGGVTHPLPSHHPIYHIICVQLFLDDEVYKCSFIMVAIFHGKKWDKYHGETLPLIMIQINSCTVE